MNNLDNLNNKAKELEHIFEGTNMALTEMRIQFDTLCEIQKGERLEMQKIHNEEKRSIHQRYHRIIACLSLATAITSFALVLLVLILKVV